MNDYFPYDSQLNYSEHCGKYKLFEELSSGESLLAQLGSGSDEQFSQPQWCLQASLDQLQFDCLSSASTMADAPRLTSLSSSNRLSYQQHG